MPPSFQNSPLSSYNQKKLIHNVLSASALKCVIHLWHFVIPTNAFIFQFFSLQPECPSLPPTRGDLCAAPAGALECRYEIFNASFGGNVNCCCGRCDIDMTCAPDSTTGSGFWQPLYSTLCPAEGCGSEGEYGVDGILKMC